VAKLFVKTFLQFSYMWVYTISDSSMTLDIIHSTNSETKALFLCIHGLHPKHQLAGFLVVTQWGNVIRVITHQSSYPYRNIICAGIGLYLPQGKYKPI